MRLKKLSLIAAAGLASAGLFAATATLTNNSVANDPGVSRSLSSNITVGSGFTLNIDTPDSFTFQNKILGTNTPSASESSVNIVVGGGSGDVVKTGTGTLQIDSYSGINTYNGNTFVGRTGAADILRLLSDANQGVLRIKEGQVVVSGYINQYIDPGIIAHTDAYNGLYSTLTDSFAGFRSTVLEGSSLLDFQNTPRNIPVTPPVGDGQPDVKLPATQNRLNFVLNLKAGDNNDQNQTRLNTGDDSMRLIVNISAGVQGGVGHLTGLGNVYKLGSGEFRLLNDGTFGGNMMLAGGTLTLASANGLSLGSARTVNMVDPGINPGSAYWGVDSMNGTPEWQPQYVPLATTSMLNIVGTQTIHNFQALFDAVGTPQILIGNTVDASSATSNFTEPYVVGHGVGSKLNVAAGATLILQQDFNGFFEGDITALSDINNPNSSTAGGDIVKRGKGTLALITGSALFNNLTIEEGGLIANAQSLGANTVTIRTGASLNLVQNNVGALNALINGDIGGTLVFAKSATIQNINGKDVTVGNGQIGTVDAHRAQTGFFGTVVVQDGLELILSAPGGVTFPHAGIRLITGANGEESRLSFADTNQTFRELSGDLGTKVDLGRGTATLLQNSDTTYSGKITGTGGLIKDGTGALTLDGRDIAGNSTATYAGATTVRGGTLKLAGPNQLPNTSGLILLNGASVVATGNQTFGALFGTKDSTLAMGNGTLTIGLSDAARALLAGQEASASPNPGRFLGTGSTETVSPGGKVYSADGDPTIAYLNGTNTPVSSGTAGSSPSGTRAYLQSVGLTDADVLADLAFAGTITGTGGLIKQGAETLTLTGVNTYTGATDVREGTLRINFDSIASSSSVTVEAPATLAVTVAAGESETYNQAVTGAGVFRKDGLGELIYGDNVALAHVVANEGTLTVTRTTDAITDATINSGATLNFNPPADLAINTVFAGPGTLAKSGAATLTLANANAITGFAGDVKVNEGTLATTGLANGDIDIAAGATYRATLTGPTDYSLNPLARLSGAGTLAISGGSLNLRTPNSLFTGTLAAIGTPVTVLVDNVLPSGVIGLTGSTLTLTGTNQTLMGITGDEFSKLVFGAGDTLTVTPALGQAFTFAGEIDGGAGNLVKRGEGTFSLTTTIRSNWTGNVLVNEGVLEITPAALGDASVTLAGDGTLALRNIDPVNAVDFNTTITSAAPGEGVIGKTGAGVVNFLNAAGGFSGRVNITEGELRAAAGSIGGKVFPKVTVAKDAIYAVVLSGTQVLDANSTTDFVQGEGSLAVEGGTLRLANGQSYTGNTILRNTRDANGVVIPNTGATLDLATNNITSLNGLAGESGTFVDNVAGALTIIQNTEGTFSGTFLNQVDLTVKGTEKLIFDGSTVLQPGYSLTVDGGHLQVDEASHLIVALTDGGSLYIAAPEGTSGEFLPPGGVTVSGDGNVIKSGLGERSISSFNNFTGITGGVGVDQGLLTIDSGAFANPGTIHSLITKGEGTLAIQVTSGTFGDTPDEVILPVSGDGTLAKTGDGTLILGTRANPYTVGTTGDFIVEAGKLGGTFTTSGNLIVGPNGTLSPGNSPGTVTVNGNFTTNGTLALELTADPANSDKIVVTGVVNLGGTLRVTEYGAPGSVVRGAKYTVITSATSNGIQGDFTALDTSAVNGVEGRRVLIVTPARNADVNGFLYNLGSSNGVVLIDMPKLSGAYAAHEGLGGLLGRLDEFSVGTSGAETGMPTNRLGALVALSPTASLDKTIDALSPLGYASLYAMSRDTALRQEDRIKDRLEQRRYDQAGYAVADWEAFVVGSAGMADNKTAADTPTFNYNTYGGMVGLDKKVEDGLVIGGAASYDNGTATLHQGAGKIEMNRVRGTAFMSTMVTKAWFVEGGLSAGFGDFSAKRDTVVGRDTGSTTGFDAGANINTGTIIALTEDLHLTPFIGVSYAHHEFQGFTERGSASALKLAGWSQDSLRTSVGTGLGWWIPAGDWKWKLGVDASYNHELLDTDSDIKASFASLGGGSFSTTAAALPSDSISVGPNVALNFDDMTSVSAGVTFEYGFDGRTYTGLNVAFRRRF